MKKQHKYTLRQWNKYVMRNIEKMPLMKLRRDYYFSYLIIGRNKEIILKK